MKIKELVPIFSWLGQYRRDFWKNDLMAGLTVGIMLVPQGMAYAMIAGLPPIYGLYASTIPIFIYAFFGTSRQLAVGPVAMVALLTAAGVGSIASSGSNEYIVLAIGLALIVGVMQFLFGIFRLGFVVNFISHPVISGFTSAAAIIIGMSQLKHLLGIDLPRSHHVHLILQGAAKQIHLVNWPGLLIGIGGILLIASLKKWVKQIPGSLVAVVFGILLVWSLGLADQGVGIVGSVPGGLPSFNWPLISVDNLRELLPTALAIALISFMESIAVAKAVGSKRRSAQNTNDGFQTIDPNRELVALGLANIGGSFFNAFPTTGGFSRTAVNEQAGAQTQIASIISGVLVLLTLLVLTPLFYNLPNSILAAIIMVAVFGLIDLREAKFLWSTNRTDFFLLATTFLGTLTLGIELGILIGVVLSLAMMVYRTSRPHMAVLGQIKGSHHFRNIKRFKDAEQLEGFLIIRFDAHLYFANAGYFRDRVMRLVNSHRGVKYLIIDAESINSIDSTAIHMLTELFELLKARQVRFFFCGVIGPVRDAFSKAELTEKMGKESFFLTIQDAVNFIQKNHPSSPSEYKKYTLQSNR